MTADGNSLDTSPNKVLTTGMFPPAKTKNQQSALIFMVQINWWRVQALEDFHQQDVCMPT